MRLKSIFQWLPLILLSICACQKSPSGEKAAKAEASLQSYPDSAYHYLAIPVGGKLSAASQRALQREYYQNADWYTEFRYHELKGSLQYEPGVVRRDPSAVIMHEGTYYVYYTKSEGESYGFRTGDPDKKVFPWDKSEIWYATSPDGWDWTEQGLAVGRGAPGAYDDRSVFTPEVLAHGGKFYLVYQTVKAPYVNRIKNQVGMAVANAPEGPFEKLEEPILSPTDDGEWLGEEDTRFKVKKQGSFDSQKVHDPCLLYFNNQFYLYYKGERMGEKLTMGGREIKWGVAIADQVEGPYVKSEYNPITNSGHEICVWPYQGGIAALLTSDGPEKNTIQYAKDGANFEIKSMIGGRSKPPHAAGLVRSLDHESEPLAALSWGLCFDRKDGWDYLQRFETYAPYAP